MHNQLRIHLFMSRPSLKTALARCRPGEVLAATADGRELVVARGHSGGLAVFEDRCPHQYAPLSEGYIDQDNLVCPRHNWEFRLADGVIVVPTARAGCPGLVPLPAGDDGLLDPTARSR